MSHVTYRIRKIGAFLKCRSHRQAALLVTLLVFVPHLSWGQTAAAQSTGSLDEALKRAQAGTELHIFYVHGMGIEPPKRNAGTQDFETSEEFRTGFCKLAHCTSTPVGRNYAAADLFKPNVVPTVEYLGDTVWRSAEAWKAAAPFVDHYNLDFYDGTRKGTRIYLHEINWWPLVISAKCRLIIATDAGLVDRDEKHSKICLASTPPDKDGRYKSYPWITEDDIQTRQRPWPKGAAFNRWLKHDLMDWGFADALLAVGPLHRYLVEGIRELVLDSYTPTDNQEFIIVSHSLGSYLMFSALDLQNDTEAKQPAQTGQPTAMSEPQSGLSAETINNWRERFDDVLTKTSHAYFMANQLSLLELANLDDTKGGNLFAHLKVWGDLRTNAQIVAFSDPDDLLTWKVPCKNANSVTVTNFPVKNVTRWFWLFANPESAHTTYDKNKQVLRAMVPKLNASPIQAGTGTKPVAPVCP
jgi:hypothetical protein